MPITPTTHILTYATDPSNASHLPQAVKNLATSSTWTGYLDKLRAVHAFATTCDPADLLVFTDAYDVAIAKPENLRARFQTFGVDILFSAETNCYPWPHRILEYTWVPDTPFLYLNSGGYMATAATLRRLFETHPYETAPCDQGYFTEVFLTSKTVTMALDHRCEIFQTMYGVPWSVVTLHHGTLVNTFTNTHPMFIHFNGRHDTLVDGGRVIRRVQKALNEKTTCCLADLGTPLAILPKSLENPMNTSIIECARRAAARFVPPSPTAVRSRDRENQHAFFRHDDTTWTSTSSLEYDPAGPYADQFHVEIRSQVLAYLNHIHAGSGLLDILLHDFVGIQHNTREYPHSILGFSKDTSDDVNICMPDRYAMADYRGMLSVTDPIPLESKRNALLFIGSSTGKLDPAKNTRLQVCAFAKSRTYVNAWISEVVNLDSSQVPEAIRHPPMTIPEQHTYRHLLVVDGNTACWDRLPWILASGSVCWKLDSTHECWYYPLLKPWIHYVPCTLENLDETWARVSGDLDLQRTIVNNANAFATHVLSHEGHALYMHTLLESMKLKMSV